MIKLISAGPEYAETWYQYRSDPVALLYNPLRLMSLEELRERLSFSCSDWSEFADTESFFWFVEHEGKIVGTASLQNVNHMMLTAEMGYAIFSEFRGKGLATKAVRELTRSCFENSELRKIIAFVHEDNLASQRVLEKTSYQREGLLREHFVINGSPVNEIIYGVLRRDFK